MTLKPLLFSSITLSCLLLFGCEDKGYVIDESFKEAQRKAEENDKQVKKKFRKTEKQNTDDSEDILNEPSDNRDENTDSTDEPKKSDNSDSELDSGDHNSKKPNTDNKKTINLNQLSKTQRWALLRYRLPEATVRKILGTPSSTSKSGIFTYWHYGAGDQAGKVSLLNSNDGKILWAWQQPEH